MAVTGLINGQLPMQACNKEFDWVSDSGVAQMLTAASFDQDTWDYQDHVVNEHGSTNGYTIGGLALAGRTIGYTAGTNVTKLDCDDPVWTATGTLTGRECIFVDTQSGVAATNPIVCAQTSSVDVSATDAEWRCQINASGLVTFTAA